MFYLHDGVLGGTMSYDWRPARAQEQLLGLLSDMGIYASDLIAYFAMEEEAQQT